MNRDMYKCVRRLLRKMVEEAEAEIAKAEQECEDESKSAAEWLKRYEEYKAKFEMARDVQDALAIELQTRGILVYDNLADALDQLSGKRPVKKAPP